MRTREDVIREIVRREVKRKSLVSRTVKREAPTLHAAACENFGTWNTALQYAGIRDRKVNSKQVLSPEGILRRIRRMCINGCDMTARRSVRRDRKFHTAACKYFGSWRLALEEAGIDLKHTRQNRKTPRRIDRDLIIQQIRERHRAGLPMNFTQVRLDNQTLVCKAISAFRSWARALAAAELGPPLPDAGSKWSKEKILADIVERMRSGKSCDHQQMREEAGDLLSAGRRYFGSWGAAIKEAEMIADGASKGPGPALEECTGLPQGQRPLLDDARADKR